MQDNYKIKSNAPSYQKVLYDLKKSDTNISKASGLENSVAGCGCPPCGCTGSLWTLVLSPGGVGAAGGILVGFSPI